jgi:predicted nucleic acid-binding protein
MTDSLVIDRDVDTFLSAIDIVSEHKIHLWDAVIVACMKENEITEIVTENKGDFKKIPDIKVIVPF